MPELCFLSLVLRHTREPCFIQLAEGMQLGIQVFSCKVSGRRTAVEGLTGERRMFCDRL